MASISCSIIREHFTEKLKRVEALTVAPQVVRSTARTRTAVQQNTGLNKSTYTLRLIPCV